jgi:hypothetical protein
LGKTHHCEKTQKEKKECITTLNPFISYNHNIVQSYNTKYFSTSLQVSNSPCPVTYAKAEARSNNQQVTKSRSKAPGPFSTVDVKIDRSRHMSVVEINTKQASNVISEVVVLALGC